MKRHTNRVLVWALAVSLAFHAVALFFAQNIRSAPAAADVPQRHPIEIIHIVHPTPPPPTPPPATPTPVRSARRVAPRMAAVRTVRLAHDLVAVGPAEPRVAGTSHDGLGVAEIGSVGPAIVAPAATPSCANPNVAAHAVDAISPETPQAAQEAGAIGSVQIEVSLAASGAVTSVAVLRSAGFAPLDDAALRAARQSTYAAEVRDCRPVAGDYVFRAEFTQ